MWASKLSGGKSEVLIGVGSNIDPFFNIARAVSRLGRCVRIKRVSSFYLSKPYGFACQDDFVNGCISIEYDRSPEELKFNILKKIEASVGRVRTLNKNSPRTIDLDILLFGNLVIDKNGMIIPDPEMFMRNYILWPARELVGEMVNPVSGKALEEYASDMDGLTPVSFGLSF